MATRIRVLTVALLCLGLTVLAVAQDSRPSEEPEEKTGVEVPPIPRPDFASQEHKKDFEKALELLESGAHKDAGKLLKKMKTKVTTGAEKDAVVRALKEAKGQKAIAEVDKLTSKGKTRQALAKLEKMMPDYVGTIVGAAMVERRDEVFEQVYLLVADFEAKDKDKKPAPGGGRRTGNTGYGQNTGYVTGTPRTGEVREGTRALTWRTTADLTYLEFSSIEGLASDYRWISFSMKSEDPKKRPNVVVLFDCEEGAIRGGRGGWGGRGAGNVFRREGFNMQMGTKGQWEDVRLDMKKFAQRGDITWDDVLSLKFIHMPGVESRLVIDNVRLERE